MCAQPVRLLSTDPRILNMRTRMPFRYGIASMTAVPHLFLRVQLEVAGAVSSGIAADHLPPKWFTKNPATSFQDEIVDLLHVVLRSCEEALGAGAQPSPFALWLETYGRVTDWAESVGHPPLLAGFGPSLVERACLDAYCRDLCVPFAAALRDGRLGLQPGAIHPELGSADPAVWLPPQPLRSILARHAVGLADPLTAADVSPEQRLNDGLPQTLEECIAAYGLTHFKIKLRGEKDADLDRLFRIAELLRGQIADVRVTLDGNEQYPNVEAFRAFWEELRGARSPFVEQPCLLFVEQPLHRDASLTEETRRHLLEWTDRPPLIIDESDGELASLPRALDCGYLGTSHKNCKGVFKGVANRCLIEQRRREGTHSLLMSGEDLSNVGPVALLQDLAVHASLGIAHVERNGHHYFRGLSMLPEIIQQQMLQSHPDLYHPHPEGYPTVHIENGRLQVGSVVQAPFGVGPLVDTGCFTPISEWRPESLGV